MRLDLWAWKMILISLKLPLNVSETMRSGPRLPQHPCLWHVQNVPFLFRYCSWQASLSQLGDNGCLFFIQVFLSCFLEQLLQTSLLWTTAQQKACPWCSRLHSPHPAVSSSIFSGSSLLTYEICPRITKVSVNLNPDRTHYLCLLCEWAQMCLWASCCHYSPPLLYPAWCSEHCVQVPGASQVPMVCVGCWHSICRVRI